MGVSWSVSGLLGASDGAWAGWSHQHQHHPPPTDISVWIDARQRKTLARWVGGYRWVTKWKKYNTLESITRMCKKNSQQPQMNEIHKIIKNTHQLHQMHTKNINHTCNTKCKIIIKIEGEGILYWSMSSWDVVAVGGETSHLLLGGEDGWWYQVSVTRCT